MVEQRSNSRQTHWHVGAVMEYPFDAATRFEVTPGYRHIQFDRTVELRRFSLATGREILRDTRDLAGPESLQFGEVAAALVRDTARMGVTGPLLGQRFRFEVTPTGSSAAACWWPTWSFASPW